MNTKNQILTNGLRDTLKEIMQHELEKIPEIIESLEPKERINLVCKLMPYVFPKVHNIHPKEGEPFTFD